MFRAGWSSNTRSTSSPPRNVRAKRWTQNCASFAPRKFRATPIATCEVAADYSAQTFKHVLLPVWLLNYQYGGTTYRIVANGVTGALAGKYPKSWIKIGLLVIAILIVMLIIFLYAEG